MPLTGNEISRRIEELQDIIYSGYLWKIVSERNDYVKSKYNYTVKIIFIKVFTQAK